MVSTRSFGEKYPLKKEVVSLAASVGSNMALSGVFFSALLNPITHAGFITQTGLWLFIVEFLSIFITAWSGRVEGTHGFRKIGVFFTSSLGFFVVSVFALAFGWGIFGNLSIPSIFISSTFAKMTGRKASGERPSVKYMIPLLLGSLLLVFIVLGPELLIKLFPISEEFDRYAPADWVAKRNRGDISGEFIDRPQTLLAWGVIYFFSFAILEAVLFLKKLRGETKTPSR